MFVVLETNTFGMGTNAFCASDERFSTGDERVENTHSNFSPRGGGGGGGQQVALARPLASANLLFPWAPSVAVSSPA